MQGAQILKWRAELTSQAMEEHDEFVAEREEYSLLVRFRHFEPVVQQQQIMWGMYHDFGIGPPVEDENDDGRHPPNRFEHLSVTISAMFRMGLNPPDKILIPQLGMHCAAILNHTARAFIMQLTSCMPLGTYAPPILNPAFPEIVAMGKTLSEQIRMVRDAHQKQSTH